MPKQLEESWAPPASSPGYYIAGAGPAPAEGVQTLAQHHGLTRRQDTVAHRALGGLGVQNQAPLIQLHVLQVVAFLLLLLPLGTRGWGRGAGQGLRGGQDQEGGRTGWGWAGPGRGGGGRTGAGGRMVQTAQWEAKGGSWKDPGVRVGLGMAQAVGKRWRW